jgi:hypothetical protein
MAAMARFEGVTREAGLGKHGMWSVSSVPGECPDIGENRATLS